MTVILNPENENREKMWKVIRGIGRFTFNDVITLVGLPYPVVSRYMLLLYQAGYIRQDGRVTEADGKRKAAWRVAKNTGPKAPQSCRCIYDPNIDDVAKVDESKKATSNAPSDPPLKVRGGRGSYEGGSHVE